MLKTQKKGILEIDPYLEPYEKDLKLRTKLYEEKRRELLGKSKKLSDFANGHKFFGIHRTADGWVYREWAPGAEAMFFTGDFNGWDMTSHPMKKCPDGVFEIELRGKNALRQGQ